MSTSYYRVRDGYRLVAPTSQSSPPTWWAVQTTDGVEVAIVHAGALRLVVDSDSWPHAAESSGGRVQVNATGLDSEWVVSEYGEPVQLGQLRRGETP